MSELIGKELGPYRIMEQIGVGGMATVYKAYHATMDRYVAVKVLPEQMGKDAAFRQRFEREAKVIAKLEHVHILPVYDYGEQDERLFLVMRYVQAGTLKARIAAGPMDLAEISQMINQMAGALHYAHGQDVIHRDVKPANVLLDAQGDCYLTDFGLAKMLGASMQLTATGVGLGTPAYMSPEQGQGEKVDARSDIYSLGVVLYEMVTGRVPYEAETPLAVVLKHITAPLPMPSSVKPDVPPAVERAILKALAKNPDDRYATPNEMAAAFQRALTESETLPWGPTVPDEVSPPALETAPTAEITEAVEALPRRKLPAWAFAVGGVALLAVVGVILLATGVFSGSEQPTSKPQERLTASPPPTPEPTASTTPIQQPTPAPTQPVVVGKAVFVDSGQRLGSGGAHAVALGDVDGDGDLDAFSGSKVWLNDGGAQEGTAGRFTDSGQSLGAPHRVALGDLDGDGDLDAFFGSSFGQSNQVWLNISGAQGVTPGTFVDSGQDLGEGDTWAVALGDVDGDGDLDAFVGNWGADKVWLNDGGAQGGTPGAFTDSGQSLGDTETRAVSLEDLDGDGDLDAFVASYSICKVWLNSGTGTFSDSGQNLCASNNVSLDMGDLDGDGDLDAFIGNGAGNPDHVWFNNGGAQGGTPGTFSDSFQRLGNLGSEAVALGDFDGDGDLDAFVTNEMGPDALWLNDGGGGFVESDQSLSPSAGAGLALGDVDGDGDLDALVGSRGPSEIWLNQQEKESVTGVTATPPVMIEGSGVFVDSGQALGNSNSQGVALGDLDGDGDLDAFVANHEQANEVWLNDGGVFADSGQSLGDSFSNAVALGDLDGDGDLDAFVGNSQDSHTIWLNEGGNFSDSGQSLGGSDDGWAVALGDLDGDGDLDAFDCSGTVNKVWLNDGGAQGGTPSMFKDSGQALEGLDSVAVALGDLDGDGDLDAFVGNLAAGEPNTVWMNNGAGRFTSSGQLLGRSGSIAVALGDLDGDGDLDAFVGNGNQGSQVNKVWRNSGAGRFSDSGQSLGNSDTWSVALGDLDDDGDLDAFVGNGVNLGGQANEVWLNSGGLQGGTPGVFIDSGQRLGDFASHEVILADLDGDGDLDAFVGNDQGQPNKVWLNQGQGQAEPAPEPSPALTRIKWTYTSPDPIWYLDSWGDGLATGDLNDDGIPDVVLGTSGGYVIAVNGDSGEEMWSLQVTLQEDAHVNADAVDVDGDGILDVVATGSGPKAAIVALDKTGNLKWESQGDLEEATDLAYADLDGDGDTDVIAAVGTYSWGGGQVIAFDGATGDRIWTQSLGSGHTQGLDAKDANGDGDIEIAVENYDNQVFLLDGTSGEILWSQPKEWYGRDVLFADVDGDGTDEIISGGGTPAVYATNGDQAWTAGTEGMDLSAGDVNGDGRNEVLISSSFGGEFHVLDGRTGETLWSRTRGGAHTVGDVNGDGLDDILVATIRHYGIEPPYSVEALDGSNNLLWRHDLDEIFNQGGFGLATANLDGDPAQEVLIANGTQLLALDTH